MKENKPKKKINLKKKIKNLVSRFNNHLSSKKNQQKVSVQKGRKIKTEKKRKSIEKSYTNKIRFDLSLFKKHNTEPNTTAQDYYNRNVANNGNKLVFLSIFPLFDSMPFFLLFF